jgi:glycosyltransferase involved in cell wall biosynthesis
MNRSEPHAGCDWRSSATAKRGVAALGNSEDIGTWSGIPHFLLRAGTECGFFASGLDLRIANAARSRGVWQVTRIACAQRPRGFQYSKAFLDLLVQKAAEQCESKGLREVISHYQLLPARDLLKLSIRMSYYIDTTLKDLFETHEMLSWLNERVVKTAIERECESYRSADRVVTMASWVRTSLTCAYGLPADRIFTVLPGANLPEKEVKARLAESAPPIIPDRFTEDRKLRIGFTGKDWKRKGLPRLVAAVEILNRMAIPAEVVVIGDIPEHYQTHQSVCAVGFIDKSRELHRFIKTVASCDIGCAPSHEEPLGIAPLEYLRLGIPVLCTSAGGLKDVCEAAGPASILLCKDATAEEIATEFESLVRDIDRFRRMRAVAWERKEHFCWERVVRDLQAIWGDCSELQ